ERCEKGEAREDDNGQKYCYVPEADDSGGGNGTGGDDTGNGPDDDLDNDGYTADEGDCDDKNPDIGPNQPDFVGDSIDENCDGIDGQDRDSDGFASEGGGGDDCDDDDAAVNPDAKEVEWDGIDQDCVDGDLHPFVDVDAGFEFTCAIAANGVTLCWGNNS